MSDIGCQVLNVRCRMSGVECQVSDARCRMSGVGCQVSDVRCRMSGVECRMSGVKFPCCLLGEVAGNLTRRKGLRAYQSVELQPAAKRLLLLWMPTGS